MDSGALHSYHVWMGYLNDVTTADQMLDFEAETDFTYERFIKLLRGKLVINDRSLKFIRSLLFENVKGVRSGVNQVVENQSVGSNRLESDRNELEKKFARTEK